MIPFRTSHSAGPKEMIKPQLQFPRVLFPRSFPPLVLEAPPNLRIQVSPNQGFKLGRPKGGFAFRFKNPQEKGESPFVIPTFIPH